MAVQCMTVFASTPPSDVCPDAPECIELASIQEPICWNLQASCVDNRCLCLKDGYNPCNCRPEVGDCQVKVADYSGSAATAYMGRRQIKTNSCVKEHQVSQQQVHVISMHRGIEVGDNMEDTTVDVQPPKGGNPQNAVVLVLASYKAVRWVINLPSYLNIHRLIIIESGRYNQPDAILNLNGSTISNREKLSTSVTGWGVGDDSDGFGNTPSLLKYLQDRFGEVTSFSGTIKANRWNISIDIFPNLPETSTLSQEFPTTVSDIDSRRTTTNDSLGDSTINQSTTVETYLNDTDSDGGSFSNFCPVYICEKICLYGFDVDEYGCEICECNTSPDVICPDINCRIYCEYGYQRGSDGCERCICQPPPGKVR
ncbi:uncharacterized protein LOC117125133 [Anneissia japonica]|uniref:uncharacterized protein LOC117125133 n=1 Tax=Anneissia japonica TaxID=1529436 RepID=UPI00142588DC|nr:uncharacterized protein LOC117125133 [Anneissia japonica]